MAKRKDWKNILAQLHIRQRVLIKRESELKKAMKSNDVMQVATAKAELANIQAAIKGVTGEISDLIRDNA